MALGNFGLLPAAASTRTPLELAGSNNAFLTARLPSAPTLSDPKPTRTASSKTEAEKYVT